MPTLKPRVQVTLEPATHEVIERFAQLQNRTRGAVISDLLDAVVPPLARTIALLEAAQEAPKSIREGLRSVVEDLHGQLVEATGEAQIEFERFREQLDADLGDIEAMPTPVPVTRGSGTDTPPSTERSKSSQNRSRKRVSGE